ncbi:MAG: carbamoyltransferase HypF [Terracidiphilus sp.]|nr:carbamoyltransferase HypF [Terracidiphilus sp.]
MHESHRKPIRREAEPRREVLVVCGVVQGVGFRPFVFRLAMEEKLAGSIGNDTGGVTIEIEGPSDRVEAFRRRLEAEAPPLSRIDSVTVRETPTTGATGFRIIASEASGHVSTGIPADAATCADCLRELLDPNDRRYRYPFLNCTNCGPRYTITRRIPYDRPQTSMARFTMCPACQAEYDDPTNRRFHAQPNACPVCGPRVWLVRPAETSSALEKPFEAEQEVSGHDFSRAESDDVLKGHDFSRAESTSQKRGALAPAARSPIEEAIDSLISGQIMAIKGIGGFHLAVDATNEFAVMRLRERKHRYGKPLAVMVRDLEAAREISVLTPQEEELLLTVARPIVLARKRTGCGIAPSVAPGIPWLGVFLPYAPLQHLLFTDQRVRALVMTSANLSEEPISIDNEEAIQRLKNIADAFLMHDREILQRCDDSVMSLVDCRPQVIRRARGFVPLAVPLPFDSPPLLAVGGHLKNAFALARGRFAYQSQHLGDLENLTGLDFFREALAHLMQTFEIEPEAVVHDLHPGYLSTSWAKEWAAERNLPLIAVQHHHAHIAACMAEHGIEGPVIGLSLDGTGYGTDGRIWGGEVLIVQFDGSNPGHFERFAHLDYVPMPGGEAAIREPWRMALGGLHHAGFDVESPEMLKLLGVKPREARILKRMIEGKLNSPLTSSCGRLFDAVAAVVLGRGVVDYEAQAAIELEGVCVDERDELSSDYALELLRGDWSARKPARMSAKPLWKELLEDLRAGVSNARIASRFHAGVTTAFIGAAKLARENTGIEKVALSGGCLHNRRLARLLRTGLEEEGFQVFQHRIVSPGDGGLSYGQAVVAAAMLTKVGQ